ncbi:MAG: hypothetical protein D6733_00070 [Methanobacteriota archaeon]|nr:MAG: hypothetical protein D6733_00070 [Euryarchaeota archaeon]
MYIMNRSKILLLVSLLLLSAACLGTDVNRAGAPDAPKAAEITASEFMNSIYGGGDYVLIDVRTEEEYASGYIPGAYHIPYTEIGERIDELNLSKDTRIVVYCEAGVRSHKASDTLLGMGYTNIVDITDGIRAWKALGGELAYPGQESPDVAPLISAAELMEKRGAYKVIYLGSRSSYDEGHIPGALHIDALEELFDPDGAYPHLVLGKDDFEALMSGLGISADDPVVVYDDQPDHKYATRMLWILRYYGHEKAAILDGGLKSWEEAGGELSAEAPSQPEPSQYTASGPEDSLIATLEQVEAAIGRPDTVIVDATTSEEYLNEGHIPGAVFIAPEHTLNPDGTFKAVEELRDLYSSHGVTPDREVITYCHTGHRASVIWYELKELLGYPRVRLYDGSLEEWRGEGMPLETGLPATETPAPTATAAPTWTPAPTAQATTTPPPAGPAVSYLPVEPEAVYPAPTAPLEVHISLYNAVKIGDAYIYLTNDINGCLGLYFWDFTIYHDEGGRGVYEGFREYEVNQLASNPDISNTIRGSTDALDNYQIVVKSWKEGEGVTLELTPLS